MDKVINVIAKENGIRLDLYLAGELKDFSRTFIQRLIKNKKVTINNIYPSVKTKVQKNDEIKVFIPPLQKLELKPEKIALDILYEDEHIIVINKPAGMVVHPAVGNYQGTLVNALLFHCPNLSGIGGILRPGIVHRLDKDTSGVMVVAKTDVAHLSLSKQFLEHKVEKKYIALVIGQFQNKYGRINVPIGRNRSDRKKMMVTGQQSREAVTFFEVLEEFKNFSLLEVKPETGRTHQIRVHLSYIKHPVLGDREYSSFSIKKYNLSIKRQMLHAQSLKFIHPATEEIVEFKTPLPDDMQDILQKLRAELVSGRSSDLC